MSAPTPHPQQHPPVPPTGPQSSFAPPPGGHPQSGPAARPTMPPYGAHPPQGYPVHGYPAPGGQPGVPPAPRKSWFARHKILTGLGVVVLLAIVGASLGGGGDDEPAEPAAVADAGAEATSPEGADVEADTAPAEEEPAEELAPEPPAAPGVGTAVRDGKFEFTVTSVETGVPSVGDQYLSQEAQGQYVLVHMTVTNIGDEAQMFTGGNQQLTDTEGRTHESDSTAAIYLGDTNSFLTDINPGNAVEGVVVFDIPVDAVPATLSLHDSMFSGGVEVSLG
ncbi:DUF4352 domain-containing protein [Cellulosimicrobium sp. NPDC055967]|uniref:DUF4352 domain-containing protein n=1 Tax=Cellulosimicrobium sp. NPDC055967 TaxID=3345670 RepID=UPI0035E047B6